MSTDKAERDISVSALLSILDNTVLEMDEKNELLDQNVKMYNYFSNQGTMRRENFLFFCITQQVYRNLFHKQEGKEEGN